MSRSNRRSDARITRCDSTQVLGAFIDDLRAQRIMAVMTTGLHVLQSSSLHHVECAAQHEAVVVDGSLDLESCSTERC